MLNSIDSSKPLIDSVSGINTGLDTICESFSLFDEHLLTLQNLEPVPNPLKYSYLLSGIFLFLFSLFVWLYVTNRDRLKQTIRDFYQIQINNTNRRNEYSISNSVSIALTLFFIVTITVFFMQVMDYHGIILSTDYGSPFFFSLIIMLIYLVKFSVIKLLGFIFQEQKKADEYIASVFLFANVMGLFLLPVVICLTFLDIIPSKVFVALGMALLALFIIIRIAKGMYIGLKSPAISKIYLFMYLCALEILPFVLMFKLFTYGFE